MIRGGLGSGKKMLPRLVELLRLQRPQPGGQFSLLSNRESRWGRGTTRTGGGARHYVDFEGVGLARRLQRNAGVHRGGSGNIDGDIIAIEWNAAEDRAALVSNRGAFEIAPGITQSDLCGFQKWRFLVVFKLHE